MKRHWAEISDNILALEAEIADLRQEWNAIKDACKHRKLPRREPMEPHRDICPDCGFVAYGAFERGAYYGL